MIASGGAHHCQFDNAKIRCAALETHATKILRQGADLFVLIINKFSARLRMHPSETVSESPDAPAGSFARIEYCDTTTTVLQGSSRCQSCESGSHDHYG